MYYRTRTYLAGDWTGDNDLISEIQKWNESNHWNLSFPDAHELTQARDTSKACSIKASLRTRLNASKTFVLVVGEHTNTVTKGSCQHCFLGHNVKGNHICFSGGNYDSRSFVEYECEMALKDQMNIIVIYNSLTVDKNKCPKCLWGVGKHIPGLKLNGQLRRVPDYQAISDAIMKY